MTRKTKNILVDGTLSRWANVFGIIGGCITLGPLIFRNHFQISKQTINILVDVANLIISVYFLYIVNIGHTKLSTRETDRMLSNFKPEKIDRHNLIERSFVIIGQFRHFMSIYLSTCVFFYIIQVVKNCFALNSDKFLSSISTINELGDITHYVKIEKFVLYLLLDFGENLFNFISAIGVIYAFICLYFRTLDDFNKSNIKHLLFWLYPVLFVTVYFIILFIPGTVAPYSLSFRFNLLRFIPGMLNGLGMVLLFGRIQAVEYFFKFHLAESRINRLFNLSIIIFLPLYAIVQPIFALFNSFKELSGESIQAITLIVCFLGKVSFLIAVLSLLQNKFIDQYVVTVLITQDRVLSEKQPMREPLPVEEE